MEWRRILWRDVVAVYISFLAASITRLRDNDDFRAEKVHGHLAAKRREGDSPSSAATQDECGRVAHTPIAVYNTRRVQLLKQARPVRDPLPLGRNGLSFPSRLPHESSMNQIFDCDGKMADRKRERRIQQFQEVRYCASHRFFIGLLDWT